MKRKTTEKLFQGSSAFAGAVSLSITKSLIEQFPLEIAEVLGKFKNRRGGNSFNYSEKIESDRYLCQEGDQLIHYHGRSQTAQEKEVIANHSVGGSSLQYQIGEEIEVEAGDILLVKSLFLGKRYLRIYVYFAKENYF